MMPWTIWRRFWRRRCDMAARHALERYALTVWIIEVNHMLKQS